MMNERLAKPEWLKVDLRTDPHYAELKQLMRRAVLHTVCEEARCPNIFECWNNRTATFMILGDTCTRACRFCAVKTGAPGGEVDMLEPARVALAAEQMHLQYVVVTSVARDDLEDGGASMFAATIRALRQRMKGIAVEVLIPDFMGNEAALKTVLEARPDVLNHNVETVERLTPKVRAKATYRRSLELLKRSKMHYPYIPTKSSIMVGLGETEEELIQTFRDLRDHEVDIVTIGQYLQPTRKHLPVLKYYHPDAFARLKEKALSFGFKHVEAGPLVRSSYHAHEQSASLKSAP
ncbi:MAG: Lipoate synthase [Candidatus Carbobacillus altaicus]|uniref:Lipoyl synthase n=1 Tax=Candidatus Carbonibacillus altaicus TaxID=2163959 RepID=A0A2R6Y4R4_9BACL|nr:MAG: Lipoate synthase [Candidatus Carbobacillus altaicus]